MSIKLFISIIFLFSSTAFAKDIKIEVLNNTELKIAASGIYQATKDSFFCKELSWNEGSPRRVAKRMYPTFESETNAVLIPAVIDSKCNYERLNDGSISFSLPGAEAYNVVSVRDTGKAESVQKVTCKKIMSGPNSKTPMVRCIDMSVETDTEGLIQIEVELE